MTVVNAVVKVKVFALQLGLTPLHLNVQSLHMKGLT